MRPNPKNLGGGNQGVTSRGFFSRFYSIFGHFNILKKIFNSFFPYVLGDLDSPPPAYTPGHLIGNLVCSDPK